METRQQLKERHQQEGKWENFLAIRERLKADGLPPDQAREQALAQVDSLPPRPPAAPTTAGPSDTPSAEEPGQTLAEPWPDFNKQVPTWESAAWVAENLGNPNVRPQNAPSGLAFGLLQWCRSSPAHTTTFWTSLYPKLLPSGTALQKQQETEEVKKVDKGYERLKKLLNEMQSKNEQEDAEQDAAFASRPDAAQIAGTLQRRLAGALEREGRLRRRLEELEGNGEASNPPSGVAG
jgi:hypothetical protein